jgi:hypothetical protein
MILSLDSLGSSRKSERDGDYTAGQVRLLAHVVRSP